MAKRTTPSFIVELPLSVSKRAERELLVRLDVCRQLYNACLGEALRRLDRMRDSLDWQRAKALKGKTKAMAQARGEAFQATRARYGFTSASILANLRGRRQPATRATISRATICRITLTRRSSPAK